MLLSWSRKTNAKSDHVLIISVMGSAFTIAMPSIIITLYFGEVSFIPVKPFLVKYGSCVISVAYIYWHIGITFDVIPMCQCIPSDQAVLYFFRWRLVFPTVHAPLWSLQAFRQHSFLSWHLMFWMFWASSLWYCPTHKGISTIPPITFGVNGLWPARIIWWRKRVKVFLRLNVSSLRLVCL